MKLKSQKKNKSVIIIVVILALVLVAALVVGGIYISNKIAEEQKQEEEDKAVRRIAISIVPKTEYYVGDELDLAGLKIQVIAGTNEYSYFVSYPNSDIVVTGFDSSVANDELPLTVSYQGFTATFNVKIISICPVLVTDRGVGTQSFPLCWIPFDNLRPYLVQREVMITDKNNGARMSYDDLFIKRRFASNIYKESNLQNRMILDYNATPEDVKREQERIQREILNEEQDLWEY